MPHTRSEKHDNNTKLQSPGCTIPNSSEKQAPVAKSTSTTREKYKYGVFFYNWFQIRLFFPSKNLKKIKIVYDSDEKNCDFG